MIIIIIDGGVQKVSSCLKGSRFSPQSPWSGREIGKVLVQSVGFLSQEIAFELAL